MAKIKGPRSTSIENLGTSIWIPISLKVLLDDAKCHPREPYYQVIERLLEGQLNGGSG